MMPYSPDEANEVGQETDDGSEELGEGDGSSNDSDNNNGSSEDDHSDDAHGRDEITGSAEEGGGSVHAEDGSDTEGSGSSSDTEGDWVTDGDESEEGGSEWQPSRDSTSPSTSGSSAGEDKREPTRAWARVRCGGDSPRASAPRQDKQPAAPDWAFWPKVRLAYTKYDKAIAWRSTTQPRASHWLTLVPHGMWLLFLYLLVLIPHLEPAAHVELAGSALRYLHTPFPQAITTPPASKIRVAMPTPAPTPIRPQIKLGRPDVPWMPRDSMTTTRYGILGPLDMPFIL
jgi:hypothetical protein